MSPEDGDTSVISHMSSDVQHQEEARAAALSHLLHPQPNPLSCGVSSTATTSTTFTSSTTTASTTLMGTGYCVVSPAVSLNFSCGIFPSTANSSSFTSHNVVPSSTLNLPSGSALPTSDLVSRVLSTVLQELSSISPTGVLPSHQNASYIPERNISDVPLTTSRFPPQLPDNMSAGPNVQPSLAFSSAPSSSLQAASAAFTSTSSTQDQSVSHFSDVSQARAYPLHQGRVPSMDQGPGDEQVPQQQVQQQVPLRQVSLQQDSYIKE